jgi:single-strand DNA-binding protein
MVRMDLIGHIGQDAIVRDVAGNSMKAIGFSVAHTEKYKDAQGVQRERTTWISCTLWRSADRLAIVPYLTKGTKVFVSGQPSAAGYVSQSDGQAKGDLRLRVDTVELLGAQNNNQQQGSFNGGAQQPSYQPKAPTPSTQIPDNDEIGDLPF